VACEEAAAIRSEPVDALPAAPLTALAGVLVVLERRSTAQARRWLDDPPYRSDVPGEHP
jgi:hypothetical protein